jgi:hypothetical protein
MVMLLKLWNTPVSSGTSKTRYFVWSCQAKPGFTDMNTSSTSFSKQHVDLRSFSLIFDTGAEPP